jgi:hypothetical protein
MNKVTLRIQEEQEDALSELVLALEKGLGCKVYEVESEDARAIAILQTVFGKSEQAPADEKAGEKKAAGKKKKNRRIEALYTVLNGEFEGKQLMGTGLAKMLKKGTLPVGTLLSHPDKGEQMVVKTAPMSDVPTMIISAFGEEIGEEAEVPA